MNEIYQPLIDDELLSKMELIIMNGVKSSGVKGV